jgi:hypothetical protein
VAQITVLHRRRAGKRQFYPWSLAAGSVVALDASAGYRGPQWFFFLKEHDQFPSNNRPTTFVSAALT